MERRYETLTVYSPEPREGAPGAEGTGCGRGSPGPLCSSPRRSQKAGGAADVSSCALKRFLCFSLSRCKTGFLFFSTQEFIRSGNLLLIRTAHPPWLVWLSGLSAGL